jgi:hypothetical protein
VRRYAPDGRLLLHVDLPCERVTKIAFGGPDLRPPLSRPRGPGSMTLNVRSNRWPAVFSPSKLLRQEGPFRRIVAAPDTSTPWNPKRDEQISRVRFG